MLANKFFLFLLLLLIARLASANCDDVFKYKAYFGVIAGYGSTTWGQLIPQPENQNPAISMSTPNNVDEGGAIWGLYLGYEFLPTFALETSYVKYPSAVVYFTSEDNIFSIDHNLTQLNTNTEAVSVAGKFMLLLPDTTLRAFSSVGASCVHRADVVNNSWRLSPVFGVGFNYNFTPHLMYEIGIDYTAGYGESELDPANDFVPFLYSAFMRLAYRF